jgi:7-carboxy-7-deazaguanine synthase
MIISEIFRSIQGESSFAGVPCTFVRVAGCSLRCVYCDTPYALNRSDGEERSLEDIIAKIEELGDDFVEITGGEPLEHEETPELCQRLLDLGAMVLVETSGAYPISILPEGTISILDVKTPSSKMEKKNHWDNLHTLSDLDEVKFVIMNKEDFIWSLDVCSKYNLFGLCEVLFSPAFGVLDPVTLANWMLEEGTPGRLQMQLHKILWAPDTRGV